MSYRSYEKLGGSELYIINSAKSKLNDLVYLQLKKNKTLETAVKKVKMEIVMMKMFK